MTDHLDTLIDALDRRARAAILELEAATQRVRMLEAENQALRQRLDGLEATPAYAEQSRPLELAGDCAAALEIPLEAAADAPVEASPPPTIDAPAARSSAVLESGPQPSPQALLEQWYQRYPATFFKAHTRPLKVGIHQDLVAREPWAAKLIRRTLANYVNLPRYLKSVRTGVERVDLDGQPAGAINDDDARHAYQQLETLQARKREREARVNAERMSRKLAELSARHGH